MQKALDVARHVRTGVLKALDGYTLDEVNMIPTGFNNNLIWNLGHLISTQQALFYQHAGLPTLMPPEQIAQYAMGSKPAAPLTQDEVDALKTLALTSLDQLAEDVSNRLFAEYPPLVLGPNLSFNNFDEAAMFMAVHEGMHYGNVQSMKHVLPAKDQAKAA